MRIVDLLQPHLTDVRRVVDAHQGPMDLTRYLHLPEGIDYVRQPDLQPAERLGTGDMLLLMAGPEPGHGQEVDTLEPLLRLAGTGTVVAILLGHDPRDLPVPSLLDALGTADLQLVDLAGLGYVILRSGLVAVAGEDIMVPRDVMGRGDARPADRAALLRMANEATAAAFTTRSLQLRLHRAETAAVDTAGNENAEGLRLLVSDLSDRNRDLAGQLQEVERERNTAERRVDALERSTSLRLGQTISAAARQPGKGAARLPRQLVALWRDRPATPAVRSSTPVRRPVGTAAAGVGTESGNERLFLAATAFTPSARTGMAVAGALHSDTAQALSRWAALASGTPDDLALLVGRTDPDLLLVETAAGDPGQTWAYLGDPAAPERERDVLRAVEVARRQQRPVVLWRNAPDHQAVSLHAFAGQCDLVVTGGAARRGAQSWDRGVPLDRFGAAPSQRAAGLVRNGHWDVGLGAHHALLDQLASAPNGDGTVALAAPWMVTPSAHGVHTHTLELLASGVRVVTGPNPELAVFRDGLVVVDDVDELPAALEAALDSGPLGVQEHRRVMRTLFTSNSVPVRLAELGRLVGVAGDPTAHRNVAVLTYLDRQDPIGPLVGALLDQRHRPAEAVLGLAEDDPRTSTDLAELIDAGVQVRLVRGSGLTWADLAGHADSPLVSVWASTDRPWEMPGVWHLLDAVLALECTGADAAAPVAASTGLEHVLDLPAEGVVMRRSEVRRDGAAPVDKGPLPLEGRGARGLRMVAYPPVDVSDDRAVQ